MPKKKPPVKRTLPVIQTPAQILADFRSGAKTEKQLRLEYTKLRDQAMKQLDRLMKSGYKVPKEWRHYIEKGKRNIPKLRDLRDIRELAFSMNDIMRFINNPSASISGIEHINTKVIATLHKHGYTFIDESNIREFGDFMDKLRERKKERLLFPSGDAADFFVERTSRGLELPVDAEDLEEMFDKWLLVQK